MVPERDGWSRSAALTVMFSVGSHDWFLASCHRTVSGVANLPFEEASPGSSRCDPEPHYCHKVGEN